MPALPSSLPQFPLPMPVVKLSLPGCGLKPQQPARVVVVVGGGAVVVVVVVVGGGGAVVVVVGGGGAVVVVVGGGGAVVVVVVGGGGAVVVVLADVVVVVAAAVDVVVLEEVVDDAIVVLVVTVVVVSGGSDVVVLVGEGHVPPAPHASQQLGTWPTHAMPPGGASHPAALCLMLQLAVPLACVRQQVTKPVLPQTDFAAHCTAASRQGCRSEPLWTAASATWATQLT